MGPHKQRRLQTVYTKRVRPIANGKKNEEQCHQLIRVEMRRGLMHRAEPRVVFIKNL
jgi:hypothetical protein